MKSRLLLLILCFSLIGRTFGQTPSSCFEITRILADACGTPEYNNEMLFFTVGPNPLNTANLTVTWNSNTFLFLCQDASTAAKVAAINATLPVVPGTCPLVLEPTGGVLPAGAKVVIVTSVAFDPAIFSFTNLSGTLYMVFQCAGASSGYFKNYQAGAGTRTTTVSFGAGCTDVATYIVDSLVNQAGAHAAQDGACINFAYPGSGISYANYGCGMPPDVLSFSASSAQASICQGASVAVDCVISGSYQTGAWSGGSGTFTDPTSPSTTYQPAPGATGIETLSFNILDNCNNIVTQNTSITINPTPAVSIAASGTTTLCPGATVTLTASGADTYVWSDGSIVSSIAVSGAGVFTVIGTNTCGTGTASQSVTTVSITPVSIAVSPSATICAGGSATLTASGSGSYAWSTGSSSSSIVVNTPGPYSVIATNTCGTSNASQVVTAVSTTPVSISVSPSASICSGASTTLSASGSGSYVWSTGSVASSIVVSTPTTYSVTATTACGTTSASQDVALSAASTASISPAGSTTLCAGSSVTLNANTGTGLTYQWSANGASLVGEINSSYTANATGNITVAVTNASGCSATSAPTAIQVNNAPAAVTVNGGGTFCSATATLTASGGTGGVIYFQGTTANGTAMTTASSSQVISSSGTYYFRSYNTCGWGTEGSVTVTLSTVPDAVTVSGSGSYCNSATISALGGVGGTVYFQGNVNNGTDMSTASASQVVTASGTYYFRAYNSCGWGQQGSVTIQIDAFVPVVGAISGAQTVCANSSNLYSVASVSNATGYVWTLPNGWAGSSSSTSIATSSGQTSGVIMVQAVNACGQGPMSTLNVNVTAIDTSVTQTGQLLTANEAGASYQWMHCFGLSIPGATNQSFSPGTTGVYQVLITVGNCVQRSGCRSMQVVGVDELENQQALSVYPNPLSDYLTITLAKQDMNERFTVVVYNAIGDQVVKQEMNSSSLVLDLSKQPAGFYMLSLVSKTHAYHERFVVSR